jgi:hypothetical protein
MNNRENAKNGDSDMTLAEYIETLPFFDKSANYVAASKCDNRGMIHGLPYRIFDEDKAGCQQEYEEFGEYLSERDMIPHLRNLDMHTAEEPGDLMQLFGFLVQQHTAGETHLEFYEECPTGHFIMIVGEDAHV